MNCRPDQAPRPPHSYGHGKINDIQNLVSRASAACVTRAHTTVHTCRQLPAGYACTNVVPTKRQKVVAVAMAVQREQQHPSDDNQPRPRTQPRRMSTATWLHRPAYRAHTAVPLLLLAMLLLLRPFIVSSSIHLIIATGLGRNLGACQQRTYCHLATSASILPTYIINIASASNLTQLEAPPVCKV
jgi:hypothetical protein